MDEKELFTDKLESLIRKLEILLSESARTIFSGVQTQWCPSLETVSPIFLHLLQAVKRAGLKNGELEESLDLL